MFHIDIKLKIKILSDRKLRNIFINISWNKMNISNYLKGNENVALYAKTYKNSNNIIPKKEKR